MRQPENYFSELQQLCLQAGVKVVYTPCLPKAPLGGAARWINDTPLIQLSGRYKRNDVFWFTFFHEAGHILLHGKKDIFMEGEEYADTTAVQEKDADTFAEKWLLGEKEEKEITANLPLSEQAIKKYAEKFNTHPGIIVGRLQKRGLLQAWQMRNIFCPIELD